MSIDVESLRILCYPDPALHVVAKPVETVDDAVRSVAHRMLELMHEAEGAGLAAPQLGLPWRLFVTKATEEQPDHGTLAGNSADSLFLFYLIGGDFAELRGPVILVNWYSNWVLS